MKQWLCMLALFLACVSGTGFAADYGREQKWADEVVPGIVIGDPVRIKQTNGHEFLGIFTPATQAKTAVILVHGTGVHPDWGLIGVLRGALPDEGYTTLSIQMPVLSSEARPEAYQSTFPEAADRLKQAVAYLKAKGYARIVVLSHSMGSAMSYGYLSDKPDPSVIAWISLGMSVDKDLSKIRIPMLDMHGDHDLPAVMTSAEKRKQYVGKLPGFEQKTLVGADHFYTGMDQPMVDAVEDYLRRTLPN